jgi:hypothetical protein
MFVFLVGTIIMLICMGHILIEGGYLKLTLGDENPKFDLVGFVNISASELILF